MRKESCIMNAIGTHQTAFIGYIGEDSWSKGVFAYVVLANHSGDTLSGGYAIADRMSILEMSHVYIATHYVPYGSFSPMRDSSKTYLLCPPLDDITLD